MKFKPEDFCLICNSEETALEAATMANARLAELLAEAPVVYGAKGMQLEWDTMPSMYDTHTARLVDIREIKND